LANFLPPLTLNSIHNRTLVILDPKNECEEAVRIFRPMENELRRHFLCPGGMG
jgi:hypothetical protein